MIKAFLLNLLIGSAIFAQSYKLSGSVYNEETKEPIPFVNIRIAGTSQGTSSNLEGKFLLTLNDSKSKLIFTIVGFKRKEINADNLKNEIKIGLVPDPIQFMEIVVGTDEDPAYRVVREAIKRKEQNRAGLNSLEYDFFSKDIFLSSGEVAMVSEKFSTGYYQNNKKEKIITHSVHITENEKKNALKFDRNILDRIYVDFTQDSLTIIGNKVFLPLAKNAFDWYDYKMIEVKQAGSVHECYIQVIPKSQIQPLLKGKIVIEDSSYSMKNIDLKNNDGIRFPYVNDLNISFIQNCDRFDKYWLPTYFKAESSLKMNFQGLIGLNTVSMNQVSMFTNYKINPHIPDSVYNIVSTIAPDSSKNPKIKFVKAAELSRAQIDSLRPIPLTQAEIKAYNELDSSKTVVTQLKITGVLGGYASDAIKNDQNDKSDFGFFNFAGEVFRYLNFRDNRVDGILLGGKYSDSFFDKSFSTTLKAGYAFAKKKVEANFSLSINFNRGFIDRIDLALYSEARQWQILNPFPDWLNSANVLIGFGDQFNYYDAGGFNVGFKNNYSHKFSISAAFCYEKQQSIPALKYQSFFAANRNVRPNPEIMEGNDSKISIGFAAGKSPQEYQPMLNDGIIAQIDFSNPALGSNFNYKRGRILLQYSINTIYKELFSSPYLVLGLEGAALLGSYGPQHTITPASALNIYSPFTTFKGIAPYEYVGDRLIAVHVEHNWRTIPYQALGLDFLTNLNFDFMTGFSALKMWSEKEYPGNHSLDKIYWESYISFGKILGFGSIIFSYNSNNIFVVRAGLSTIL